MPGRFASAGLSADEIMVLQRVAMGLTASEITRVLRLDLDRIARLEASAYAKLCIVEHDDPRAEAGRLYRAWGETLGFKTRIIMRAPTTPPKERPMQGHADIERRYAQLPEDLLVTARWIHKGVDNFRLADRLGVDINEAGKRVSRLYAALGFERSMGYERRAIVVKTFVDPKAVPTYDAHAVGKAIAALSPDDRKVVAELAYAKDPTIDVKIVAASMKLSVDALIKRLAGILRKLGLSDTPDAQLLGAIKEGWAEHRKARSEGSSPAQSIPLVRVPEPQRPPKRPSGATAHASRPGIVTELESLLNAAPLVQALKQPHRIVDLRLLKGQMAEGEPAEGTAEALEAARAAGFEPEVALIGGDHSLHALLVKRK